MSDGDGKRPAGERPARFATAADIPLPPVYDAATLAARQPPFDEARDLGRPGEPPFTRGVHAGMYRDRLWTMRQYAGFGSAACRSTRTGISPTG